MNTLTASLRVDDLNLRFTELSTFKKQLAKIDLESEDTNQRCLGVIALIKSITHFKVDGEPALSLKFDSQNQLTDDSVTEVFDALFTRPALIKSLFTILVDLQFSKDMPVEFRDQDGKLLPNKIEFHLDDQTSH